ncbi:MAG: hypothetical protein WC008_03375 [Bacilli bacterium]
MINVKNLLIDNIAFSFNIEENDSIAFYGKREIVTSILLSLAGIIKNMNTITFKDHDVYDYQNYFNERIYIDCSKLYFQTIIAKEICFQTKTKYNKIIDEVKLSKHISKLHIRGECEVTDKYTLTDIGNNLINLSFALSSKNHVLINNPFINIDKIEDFEYFKKEILSFEHCLIVGTQKVKPISKIINRIILIGDQSYIDVNEKSDKFYIIDQVEDITPFMSLKDKYLLVNPDKEIIKKCNTKKVKMKKIEFGELDFYIGELL